MWKEPSLRAGGRAGGPTDGPTTFETTYKQWMTCKYSRLHPPRGMVRFQLTSAGIRPKIKLQVKCLLILMIFCDSRHECKLSDTRMIRHKAPKEPNDTTQRFPVLSASESARITDCISKYRLCYRDAECTLVRTYYLFILFDIFRHRADILYYMVQVLRSYVFIYVYNRQKYISWNTSKYLRHKYGI